MQTKTPGTTIKLPCATTFERTYPGKESQVRRVRADLARVADECPFADDLILIASELVTNAVVHSRSGVAVPTLAGGHPAVAARSAVAKSAGPARPGTQTAPVGGANAVPAAVVLDTMTSSADYIPQPAGPKAPTSSAAVLDELLKLLPPGATSDYTYYTNLGAQLHFDGPSGLGMVRLSLFKGSLNPGACASAVPSDMTRTCSTLPSGAAVLTTRISDNCIEPLVIDVDHGGGTVVEITVSTCLTWNGHSNPPTQMSITAAQALRIVANPAWGTTQMDAFLVRDASSRFADLPVNARASESAGS